MTLGEFTNIDNKMVNNPSLGAYGAQFNYELQGLQNQQWVNSNTGTNNFMNNYLKPLNYGISTLGTLGSLWLGFKQYGLAKQQLGIAKEQWSKTKEELNRIKSVRERLTDSYMNS